MVAGRCIFYWSGASRFLRSLILGLGMAQSSLIALSLLTGMLDRVHPRTRAAAWAWPSHWRRELEPGDRLQSFVSQYTTL
jgi:hypothetical protein